MLNHFVHSCFGAAVFGPVKFSTAVISISFQVLFFLPRTAVSSKYQY